MRSIVCLGLMVVMAAFAMPAALGSPPMQVVSTQEMKSNADLVVPERIAPRPASQVQSTSAQRVSVYQTFYKTPAGIRKPYFGTDAKVRVDPGWRRPQKPLTF